MSVTKHQILALCGAVGVVSSGCETPMEIVLVFHSHLKLAKSKRGTGVNKATT